LLRLSLWPDAGQLLLLKASIGEAPVALDAFDKWIGSVDYVRHLDGGSFRLLPLLHAHQKRLGNTHAALDKLAGVYRRSWCEVQLQLKCGERIVGLLQDQGIAVLVSKGLALSVCYYDSPAMRPMSDLDLVVPRAQARHALDILAAAGWCETPEHLARWSGRRGDMLALTNGVALVDAGGREIDLHWRMMQECNSARIEGGFWRNALPMALGDRTVLRPDASTLLFHTIVHGVRPNALPPIRWIADAAMILRRDGERIDWQAMLGLGRKALALHRLGVGLEYLRTMIGLPVPEEIVAIATARPGLIERREARGFGAELGGASAAALARIGFPVNVARLAMGDARGQLPRLAMRWLGQRARRWHRA
jgi:hypothetical protein